MGIISTNFFKFLRRIERSAAFAQGKGYGTATIQQEVKLLQSFLKTEPKLAIDIGGNIGIYTAELRRKIPIWKFISLSLRLQI